MDRFETRAAIAIAAFVVIGAASVVVSAQQQAPESLVTCIDRAERETLLSDEEISELCFGATSEGPAICYDAARDRTFLSNVEAIRLCRCAASDRPVQCFEEVRERTDLWTDPSIGMCSEITTRRLRSDCSPTPLYP
jgi:hypothetical protein